MHLEEHISHSNYLTIVITLLITALVLSCCGDSVEPGISPDTSFAFMPLKIGNEWEYENINNSNERTIYTIVELHETPYGDSAIVQIQQPGSGTPDSKVTWYWHNGEFIQSDLNSENGGSVQLKLSLSVGSRWRIYDISVDPMIDFREATVISLDSVIEYSDKTDEALVIRLIRYQKSSDENEIKQDTVWTAYVYNIGMVYYRQDQVFGFELQRFTEGEQPE